MKITPRRGVQGSVALPGDKSISHRYAMLAALAEGESKLANFSTGADCQSTLACMEGLGAEVKRADGVISILGAKLRQPNAALDCGNSGSTMRMLSGILAGQPFASELIGDESLSRRPMRRVIEPLERMGARINSSDGRAPLRIHGGRLTAIDYSLPVASAQVKSAVLLAGLFARGETWVEEPVRTRDHTEIALGAFGAVVQRDGMRAGIAGGQALHAVEAVVPGDLSSAAFFLCAAAIFPGSQLIVENVLLNPRRAVLLDTLTAMGAQISILHVEERLGELAGAVRVIGGMLRGGTIAGAQTAALIDELPVLAAVAPYTSEGIEIRDAAELRHKESDRIAAVTANLQAMGAEVEERADGLRVRGGQPLHGAEIDSRGDHRIAMAFAVAALRAEGESVIRGADSARISFPEFFQLLDAVARD
ncbi:MAG: 3-phosphoshikimate 1-carboxyvinyltransferase [Terriglobales bacterium]